MTIHADATVDPTAHVGSGTAVWAFACIRDGARVGDDCVVGRGVYIDSGVVVGDRCKIEDYALLYRPAVLGEGVFVGPGAILSNDRHPRAVSPGGDVLRQDGWDPQPVCVRDGATIGAGTTIVAGVTIGSWAMIGAGSVVTQDVADFGLAYGAPATRHSWVGRAGRALDPDADGSWRCPSTGERYVEADGCLRLER